MGKWENENYKKPSHTQKEHRRQGTTARVGYRMWQ